MRSTPPTVAIGDVLHQSMTDDEVGKIMGGNFFRVWQQVSDNAVSGDGR